jgi:hypothetical protein
VAALVALAGDALDDQPPRQLEAAEALRQAVSACVDDEGRRRCDTAMKNLRIVILGFGTARQNMVLE